MHRITAALLGGFLLAGCANAKEIYTAGDSLCVGLAQAAKLRSVARVGAPAREVASQLGQVPHGATVIVCAGTNDAPNRGRGIEGAINAVIDESRRKSIKLIWIGPIGTPLWWDKYSDQIDTKLALIVPHYISLRAIGWNRGEHDGQFHLTPKGYERLWRIVKEKL